MPAAVGAALALAESLIFPPRPRLLWNASSSSPRGLYAVTAPASLRRGDSVVAWLPPASRKLASARAYLPATVPLVKRVAAVRGDRVCAAGAQVRIDGRPVAVRRSFDPSGRPMPWWRGCQLLRGGEIFLLSANAPLAFDGRYFGITRPSEIVGKAHLLWPR